MHTTSCEVDANGFCTQQQTRLRFSKVNFLFPFATPRKFAAWAPVHLSLIELDFVVDTNPELS